MNVLKTERLALIPANLELVTAELRDRAAFARLLSATVPPNWPPESLADALPLFVSWLQADPHNAGWYGWYAVADEVDDQPLVLVASCGFKGPPREGTVEIGYSVLAQFERRGFASEMSSALVAWALTQPSVYSVVAETEWANPASVRVLEKIGFRRVQRAGQGEGARFQFP